MQSNRPYQICTKLVVDTSDPNITFDADGISNHYHEFHEKVLPRWQTGPEGQAQLEQAAEAIRQSGRDRDFDCILGLSGGADSSYMLHKMVRDYGLRPLVFHVDAGWNSELAVHNINTLIDGLKLDLFTEVINWEEVKDFQLAMFKSGMPNIDLPQDIAFIGVLFRYAKKHNIKYILNGGNISTECVSYPLDYFYYADMRMVNAVLKKFGTIDMKTYPFSSIFERKFLMPVVHGVKVLKPLNMMPYPKQAAMDELSGEYGWKPYAQKHFESRFTRFFEGYWLPTRFGYDVRRVQFSSMILTGQMTRAEALELLKEPPYDPELIRQDFLYVATKLGIPTSELEQYHQLPLKFYWDYPNQQHLLQAGEKIMSKLVKTKRGGAY